MRFFGIPLTRVDDLDTYFYGLVRSKTPRTIVTPNPEILLHAEQDQEFRSVLLLASDRLPDGIGLYLAEIMRESGLPRWLSIILMPYWGIRLLLGRRSIESKLGHRVQGSRLTEMLLNHAAREGWTVAILDRDASDWPEKLEAQHRAPAAIETKFPGVHIHYETV
ncbi:MAG TPA: hypothetical protein PK765_04315 [bacterium]|nr:hypothetical protein [bacterium]